MASNAANEKAKAAVAAIQQKVSAGAPLKVNEFKSVVSGFKGQIEAALPVHLKKNAEKYARQALTLFSENPKLQAASPITILSALMKASSLGLDLNPQLGQCYIIPYDNKKKIGNDWVTVTEAQFQIGYRGAICLAQRSNRVARIAADVVRKGDFFEYSKGLFPKLEHKPCDGERGDITHAYALANFTNGGYCFEVWTVGQITEHAQKFSKSYYKYDYKTRKQIINPNSPWQTHFESMAKKTMIMQIWKFMPIETELLLAGAQDETTVSDISHIDDSKGESGVLEIMPDRDTYNLGAIDTEADEAAPEEPAPQPQETKQTTKKAGAQSQDDPHSEVRRMLRDNLGDLGLGLTDAEAEEWSKRNFGKGLAELSEEEIYAADQIARAEIAALDKRNA